MPRASFLLGATRHPGTRAVAPKGGAPAHGGDPGVATAFPTGSALVTRAPPPRRDMGAGPVPGQPRPARRTPGRLHADRRGEFPVARSCADRYARHREIARQTIAAAAEREDRAQDDGEDRQARRRGVRDRRDPVHRGRGAGSGRHRRTGGFLPAGGRGRDDHPRDHGRGAQALGRGIAGLRAPCAGPGGGARAGDRRRLGRGAGHHGAADARGDGRGRGRRDGGAHARACARGPAARLFRQCLQRPGR